ncbi:MAG: LapA family protein [Fluviicola sp.]|jgi:uncharacterized integral membrane protein|nr:LapA family protein [Fluviicola sp.]
MKEYWESLNTAKRIKLISSIISIILIVIFSFQNWDKSEVNFIFFSLKVPVTLIIFAAMASGYFISSLYNFSYIKRKDKEITDLKSKINALIKDKGDSL